MKLKFVLGVLVLFGFVGLASAYIGIDWIYPTSNINVTQLEFFNVSVNVSCFGETCGEINVTLDPAAGTEYNFTTCGATGSSGPTQENCTSNYTGTSLEGLVSVYDGIQEFVVPATGTYRIKVGGAVGGCAAGGKGAEMAGDFELSAGDVLQVLVGQEGLCVSYGGGGGGTYVAEGVSYEIAEPLIVAGGGGGISSGGSIGKDGVTTINGTDGQGTTGTAGLDGFGGSAGTGGYRGSGGAGFYGNATGTSSYSTGGIAFIYGGSGGSSSRNGAGGFGGGGGNGWYGGGAGGGYSGGGGGLSDGYAGGSGGSYNIGLNQNNTNGTNLVAGYVSMTYLSGKGGTVSMDPTATPFYTNVTNPYNLTLDDGESEVVNWWVNATGEIGQNYEFFVYTNLTSDLTVGNLTSVWNISLLDIFAPTVEIIEPAETTYDVNVVSLNYTYSDYTGGGVCWYSVDEGVTNSSTVSPGVNFTSLDSLEGSNTWIVYCNDSSGNVGSDSVTFTESIPSISLTLVSPTGNVNVTQDEFFEVRVSVGCSGNDCGEINVTLDPYSNLVYNESFESGALGDWTCSGTCGIIGSCVEYGSYTAYHSGDAGSVMSPVLDLSSYSLLNLTYWVRMGSSSCGELPDANEDLYVEYYNSSGSWVQLDFFDTEAVGGGVAVDMEHNLSDDAFHSDFQLRFRQTGGSGASYDYWFFDNVTITSGTSGKGGTVSMSSSATPFYTNITNPYNLSLDEGQSQMISWWVNATGTLWENYTFFVYSNRTSDLGNGDITGTWNVTIIDSMDGAYVGGSDEVGPTINFVSPLDNTNYVSVVDYINYTVSDVSGVGVCWYSLDLGVTNSSYFSPGVNFTSLSSSEGWNNWTVYCNDTENNLGSSVVGFYQDTGVPVFDSIEDQSVEFGDDLNYDIEASDSLEFGCFSVNDTDNFQINCSGYLENSVLLSVGLYNLNITINDSVGNENSELMWVNVTNTNPLVVVLNSPSDNYAVTTETNFSEVDFNCSVSDETGLANLSLYISNNESEAFSLNQSVDVTGVINSSNWTLNLTLGTYVWNCRAFDIAGADDWATNRTLTVRIADEDGDGVLDSQDTLEGTEADVGGSGVSDLNITIGGNSTSGSFSDLQEVRVYDSSDLLINFSHNFTLGQLNLNNITLIRDDNYLIVNFSGQLQENKSLRVYDNNFVSLCVKDEDVASISGVSSGCDGSNETDFTDCLGGNYSSGGIDCVDEGSWIRVDNLKFSAVRGTQPVVAGGNNGGGGGGGGGGSVVSTETAEPECTSDLNCSEGYTCFGGACVKLFDVEILKVEPLIGSLDFELDYLVKGMADINGDVVIKFWIQNSDGKIDLGQDTIYLGSFETKTKKTNLNLPADVLDGTYDLYVQVSFENYAAESFRKINADVLDEVSFSPEEKVSRISIYLVLLVFVLVGFGMFLYSLNKKYPGLLYSYFLGAKRKFDFEVARRKSKSDKGFVKKTKFIGKNPSLSSAVGKSVFGVSGDRIGLVEDVFVIDGVIYGWVVRLESSFTFEKKVLVNQRHVVSVNDAVIVDKQVEDYLNEREIQSNLEVVGELGLVARFLENWKEKKRKKFYERSFG